MTQPNILTVPFAESATSQTIQEIPISLDPSDPIQKASWSKGFPAATMQPLATGGVPPMGQDFNGILKALSEHIVYQNKGGLYRWSADVVSAGGYDKGAVVQADDGIRSYVSLTEGNTEALGGSNWLLISMPIATVAQAQALTSSDTLITPQGLGDVLKTSGVWLSKAIGEPFPIFGHLAGIEIPPTNNPNFRFIKLSAGENGVGGYNEGVLVGETVTGSAPLVVTTAVIDYAESPINGETVNLINTEGRYIKPGTSPGTVANDQMQRIAGSAAFDGTNFAADGAFSRFPTGVNRSAQGTGTAGSLVFDSANSPDARTGDHTDVKHQQVTYYMRIA